MALEDRCSPQSAPSPPGIPHSPHSTSSSISAHSPISTQLALDMSIHNQTVSKHQYEMCLSPQSNSSMVTSIKEETDSIIDPEELDDQPQPPPAHHQPSTSISFSISNILSDRFGLEKIKQHTQSITKKHIFRPYEIPRTVSPRSVSPPSAERTSAFTRLSQLSAVAAAADYSRFQQQLSLSHPTHPHHAAAAAMMVPNFLNCFNPVAYPRIHEEILNQRKNNAQHKQSIENSNKMAPLGSLCKTVSQIGQSISSPPPMSTSSTSSISSTSASPSNRIPASSPQPIPPPSVSRDSGMESSDDTKSESGSTKDENALWPAWVYCTRYSDRPSSGPRYRRPKQPKDKNAPSEEKRPRTAFSSDQLARLKREFNENRYLTERRRQALSEELGLNEAQIKIWFQNKNPLPGLQFAISAQRAPSRELRLPSFSSASYELESNTPSGDEEEMEHKTASTRRKKGTRRGTLHPEAKNVLKAWMFSPEHFAHPYPSEEEKEELANEAGIEVKQLSNWFTNARKRLWQPVLRQSGVEVKNFLSTGRGGPRGNKLEVPANLHQLVSSSPVPSPSSSPRKRSWTAMDERFSPSTTSTTSVDENKRLRKNCSRKRSKSSRSSDENPIPQLQDLELLAATSLLGLQHLTQSVH